MAVSGELLTVGATLVFVSTENTMKEKRIDFRTASVIVNLCWSFSKVQRILAGSEPFVDRFALTCSWLPFHTHPHAHLFLVIF